MESFEIGTLWERILEKTKGTLPLPIWETVVHVGLLPFTVKENKLILCAMQDYIKTVAYSNALIINSLEDAARSITSQPIEIIILTSKEMDSQNNDYTPESLPSVDYSENENNQNNITKSHALKESKVDFSQPIYSDPVYIDVKRESQLKQSLPSYINTIGIDEKILIPSVDNKTSNSPTEQPETDQSNQFLLHEEYTFSSFIVGNTNRVAYATAQTVAERPSDQYNPFFIYGESGLGKTHLIHAIGNYVREHHPSLKIMYISSEDFLNDFIKSIREKQGEIFRQKYRYIDILMIDDIQFLDNNKMESTQEEFFHTFNSLFNQKKQIILTSDTLPRDMKAMKERMRSRFQGGCVVTIDPPDLETKIAILQAKAKVEIDKNKDLQIPNEIISYIATSIDSNIRSLEGVFNSVLMNATITKQPITKELVDKELQRFLGDKITLHLSIPLIQEFIATYFKIKKEDLLGKKRTKQFAYPRQIAMYLCRDLIRASYPSIAEAFGKKDHTTILHAYEKIDKEIHNDAEIRKMIEDITKSINGK